MSAAWSAPAELNIYAAAESSAAIAAVLADLEPGDELRVDLAQVGELDAAGLQLLLATALAGRRNGHQIAFADIPDLVRERFGQFGLAAYFEAGETSGEDA
jgi:anti-anti-sigma regulatory factor